VSFWPESIWNCERSFFSLLQFLFTILKLVWKTLRRLQGSSQRRQGFLWSLHRQRVLAFRQTEEHFMPQVGAENQGESLQVLTITEVKPSWNHEHNQFLQWSFQGTLLRCIPRGSFEENRLPRESNYVDFHSTSRDSESSLWQLDWVSWRIDTQTADLTTYCGTAHSVHHIQITEHLMSAMFILQCC